ncbi:MAG: DUF1294 domain-containing protein [Campylobacterota bacterium]|nr:DUF1294 domain-containing protein [Campylobacterota bacterium]
MQKIIFIYFLSVNIVSFFIFALDKFKSIKDTRRVSEKTLHTLSLLGGFIGSTSSMLLFRHKTRKRSFLVKHILIIVLWIVGVFIYFTQLDKINFLG